MIRVRSTFTRLLGLLAVSSLALSLGCDMLRPQGSASSGKGKKPSGAVDDPTDPTDREDPSTGDTGNGNGAGTGNGDAGTAANKLDGGASGDAGPTIPSNPNGLSFQRDIRPLTERYCTECHHAGGQLFDLTQYPFVAGASQGDQANVADRAIASLTVGSMPPAPRDKAAADFAAKLRQWRADGMNP